MGTINQKDIQGMLASNKTRGQARPRGIVAATGLLGYLALAFSPQSFAELDFGVDIDLGVIRTDNILLAPAGEEQSETVYTISPEFYLTSDSDRFEADIRYRPQAYLYSDFDEADDVYHVADISTVTTLVRDRLFLDLGATSYQSIVTPEAQVPSDNLPITANRVGARTLQARPYWQQRIGQAELLLAAGYSDVDYEDSQFQSSAQTDGSLSLGNIQQQQGLAWQMDYQFQRMEYDISLPWEFQRAALNLGAWINATTRIFAVGGAETSFDDYYSSDMDADFWEVGIQYTPSQRLNLEIAAGDRSYGKSFRGSFSYQLKRGDIGMSYSESLSSRSAIFMNRGPLTSTDNLDGLLDRPGDSDRFVRKMGELNASVDLAKSNLGLRIFSERRESRSTADGVDLGDEELSGVALRWSWNLGRKTEMGVGAQLGKRRQSGLEDEVRRTSLDFQYEFSDTLSVSLEASRFDEDGVQSSEFDYTESQYRMFLSVRF